MQEKTRAKPDERLALMGLQAVRDTLDNHIEPLKGRLATDPYALRGLKSAKTSIERAIATVASTIEWDSLQYILRNSRNYEIIVRQRQITKDPVWMYVKATDLETVVSTALQGECAMCMREGGEAKACAIRKALAMMVDEPASEFGCGFRGQKLKSSDGGKE